MSDQVSVPTGQTRLAAVIGDPVRHSMSPKIHNAAFAATGLDWVYVALPVASGRGAEAVAAMEVLGIDGLNVTMPHKADVAGALTNKTDAVSKLGACNCVFRDGDQLVGDNTDGDGFVSALKEQCGADVAGMRVVVLGAGGAARAIVDALGRHGSESIIIVNRTLASATSAALLSPVASVGELGDVRTADLVVNATSIGMGDADLSPLDASLLSAGQIVSDIVYQPSETALLRDAERVGATPVGGLGMLVHQAAASFERFTGHAAPLEAMTAAVEQTLAR